MGARQWILFAIASLMLVAAATFLAAAWGRARSLDRLAQEAQQESALHGALLKTELEKYRSLPYVLARDPDLINSLSSADPRLREQLSAKLAILSKEINAYLMYVQDPSGLITSSNRYLDLNGFINCRCAGGLYFQEALRGPSFEYFAKGRQPNRSGLYITHSIPSPAGPLGVVSVKVAFDLLEKQWRERKTWAVVTDPSGIVIISSLPGWKFRTLSPLAPAARARVLASGRFGGEALRPAPVQGLADVRPADPVAIKLPDQAGLQQVLVSHSPIAGSGWTLHLLTPSRPRAAASSASAGVTGLLASLLVVGMGALVLRRREARRREMLREVAAREELERRVETRTRELTESNRRLVTEMDERRRVEGRVQRLQDDLVQANKLATLGQIAAGVAHEINQPVAAIKLYAENANLMLDRGQQDQAGRNLGVIGELTGRISAITDELRAFARRPGRSAAPVPVTEAIEGALLLVSHRLSRAGVSLRRRGECEGLTVEADRGRLEQVLVNLLQNALDALVGRENGQIELLVEPRGESVCITVADNGPGLTPAITRSLFMPFATTKPDGLGLGLVISRDIATEFGGDLSADQSADGAVFVLTLKRAT